MLSKKSVAVFAIPSIPAATVKAKYLSAFFWMFIFSLIVIEFVVFKTCVLSKITDHYPANFDQANYLNHCYTIYQNILKHGFLPELKKGVFSLSTSFIFCLQTIGIFLLFGASRLTALSGNFIYFALLQLCIVKTAKDLTGKYSFAFILLGLLLSAHTPFFWAGGIMDFRIDFMAYCLFGIFVTCIIQSDVFLNRKWAIIAAGVAVYLILLRYITVIYIYGMLAALCGYFYMALKSQKIPDLTSLKTRIKNLLLSATIILGGVLPCLWINRIQIYNYYVVNHFINKEKYIRAAQVGVSDLISNLSFYPKSTLIDHLGVKTLLLSCALFITFLVLASFRKYKQQALPVKSGSLLNLIVAVVLSCLIPLAVLTTDFAKSPVVANILVMPILWTIWTLLFFIYKTSNNKLFSLLLTPIAFISLAFGFTTFTSQLKLYPTPSLEISKMYDDIGNYFHSAQQNQIVFSVDHIRDYLLPHILGATYYEKHHILLSAIPTLLGGSLYEISATEAKSELIKSDVFIMTLTPYRPIVGEYPFNLSMNNIRPELQKIAEHTFIKLGDYHFNNQVFRVYVKSTSA